MEDITWSLYTVRLRVNTGCHIDLTCSCDGVVEQIELLPEHGLVNGIILDDELGHAGIQGLLFIDHPKYGYVGRKLQQPSSDPTWQDAWNNGEIYLEFRSGKEWVPLTHDGLGWC